MHPVEADLRASIDPAKAAFFPRFFKAGPGEYAEGDKFMGVTVPQIRLVVKKHKDTSLEDIEALLHSEWHEIRLAALLLLVHTFKQTCKHANMQTCKHIVDLYLRNTNYVNNWDLVDSSAHYILGPYLDSLNDTSLLDELAQSGNLWKQRIAIISTFHFIRKNQFEPTFRIAEKLLDHPHDLIHKAVGWMLREVGNRDEMAETGFLNRHYKEMPRTMLRYAIEKFNEPKRQKFLKGNA